MRAVLAALLLLPALGGPSAAASSGRGPKVPSLPSLEPPVSSPLPSAPAVPPPSGLPALPAAPELLSPPALPGPPAAAAPAAAALVSPMRRSVQAQLAAMAEVVGREDAPLFISIQAAADGILDGVEARLAAGEIDPAAVPGSLQRPERVGFYPVSGDPLHWGHLLIGLEAVHRLGLDRVVYVPAGDDPRKPSMTPAQARHPVIRAVLEPFSPLLQYSPIALGTALDGETNLFRFLAENASRRLRAYYLVGDDHYRFRDARGGLDTIPKIEANMRDPSLGYRPGLHQVSLAFIEREGRRGEMVPTGLEVRFLPRMPFEASSNRVRSGSLALMPYEAYRFVKGRALGLYGISKD